MVLTGLWPPSDSGSFSFQDKSNNLALVVIGNVEDSHENGRGHQIGKEVAALCAGTSRAVLEKLILLLLMGSRSRPSRVSPEAGPGIFSFSSSRGESSSGNASPSPASLGSAPSAGSKGLSSPPAGKKGAQSPLSSPPWTQLWKQAARSLLCQPGRLCCSRAECYQGWGWRLPCWTGISLPWSSAEQEA